MLVRAHLDGGEPVAVIDDGERKVLRLLGDGGIVDASPDDALRVVHHAPRVRGPAHRGVRAHHRRLGGALREIHHGRHGLGVARSRTAGHAHDGHDPALARRRDREGGAQIDAERRLGGQAEAADRNRREARHAREHEPEGHARGRGVRGARPPRGRRGGRDAHRATRASTL